MQIKSLRLFSKNLEAQEHFYGKQLGFQCETFSKTEIKVLTQENVLIFESSPQQVYYHFAFLIPTGGIPKAIEFLKAKKIELLLHEGNEIVEFQTGRAIYFYDRDGNIVEFIERPKLDYPPKTNFSIDQLIKINEIGLPVHDPKATAAILQKSYGIIPMDPDSFSDAFCWVGDEDGVIIVTQLGRHWLPTDKPGVVNNLMIHYEDGGKEYGFRFENNEIKPSGF